MLNSFAVGKSGLLQHNFICGCVTTKNRLPHYGNLITRSLSGLSSSVLNLRRSMPILRSLLSRLQPNVQSKTWRRMVNGSVLGNHVGMVSSNTHSCRIDRAFHCLRWNRGGHVAAHTMIVGTMALNRLLNARPAIPLQILKTSA